MLLLKTGEPSKAQSLIDCMDLGPPEPEPILDVIRQKDELLLCFDHCGFGLFVTKVSSILVDKTGHGNRWWHPSSPLLGFLTIMGSAISHGRPIMTRHCVSDLISIIFISHNISDGWAAQCPVTRGRD